MRRGTSFSYLTACVPSSLIVVTPGRSSVSISWAITPVSAFPSYGDVSFQLKVLPLIESTLPSALGIGVILSFSLLSELANAVISPKHLNSGAYSHLH